MKKILFPAICLMMTICLQAQTNFREITFDQAIAAAKAENKLVFVDVMTSWCGPCKRMASDVFPQKMVGDFMNQHFVNIKIDAEKGEGIGIAKTYKVDAYPTFLILKTDKSEMARLIGGRSAETFVTEVERMLDPMGSPDLVKDLYSKGDRTTKVMKYYASIMMDEAKNDRRHYEEKMNVVYDLVIDYFNGLTDAQRLDPENMFVYADYLRSTEDSPAKFMTKNVNKFPAESKQQILDIIKRLYEGEEYALLSGGKDFTLESLNIFKKELKQLKLNSDGGYDNSLKLLEVFNGDSNNYIQMCRQLFNKLNKTQQTAMMQGLAKKFATADEATKKAASRVIREQLPDMDYEMIGTAFYAIMDLERKGH